MCASSCGSFSETDGRVIGHLLVPHCMVIGERIRELRESKNLSQGDMEHLAGLIRCYTSCAEHAHTVPTVETLESLATDHLSVRRPYSFLVSAPIFLDFNPGHI